MFAWIADIEPIAENGNGIATRTQARGMRIRIDAFSHATDDSDTIFCILFCKRCHQLLRFLRAPTGTYNTDGLVKRLELSLII